MEFKALVCELVNSWETDVENVEEAVELKDEDGGLWFLEFPSDSELFTLYSPLAFAVDEQDFAFWLSINSQRDLLGCAWVSLFEQALCLGVSLPKDKFDLYEVENIFQQLYWIKQQVLKMQDSDASTQNISNAEYI